MPLRPATVVRHADAIGRSGPGASTRSQAYRIRCPGAAVAVPGGAWEVVRQALASRAHQHTWCLGACSLHEGTPCGQADSVVASAAQTSGAGAHACEYNETEEVTCQANAPRPPLRVNRASTHVHGVNAPRAELLSQQFKSSLLGRHHLQYSSSSSSSRPHASRQLKQQPEGGRSKARVPAHGGQLPLCQLPWGR